MEMPRRTRRLIVPPAPRQRLTGFAGWRGRLLTQCSVAHALDAFDRAYGFDMTYVAAIDAMFGMLIQIVGAAVAPAFQIPAIRR